MKTIRTYIGTARPGPTHVDGHDLFVPTRPFLLFLQREIMGEHDRARARREIERRGWIDVKIERGGRVINPERLNAEPEHVRKGYSEASATGSSLLVFKRQVLAHA